MNTLEGTQPPALIAGILSKEENKELLSHSGRKCRLFIPSCFFFFPSQAWWPFESRPHQPESHQQREDRSDEWKKSSAAIIPETVTVSDFRPRRCLFVWVGLQVLVSLRLLHSLTDYSALPSRLLHAKLPPRTWLCAHSLRGMTTCKCVSVCATVVILTGPPSVNNSVSQWHKANQHSCQLFRDSRQHGFPLVINRCLVIYKLFHYGVCTCYAYQYILRQHFDITALLLHTVLSLFYQIYLCYCCRTFLIHNEK